MGMLAVHLERKNTNVSLSHHMQTSISVGYIKDNIYMHFKT